MKRKCRYCHEKLEGRVDKLFCDAHCRASFHYQRNKEKDLSLFAKVDRQLKLNRRLLKHFNTAGKATIRTEALIKEGFDPSYFTHFWRTKDNRTYFFCYDMGYFETEEHGKRKYVLVHWQDYMSPSVPKSKTGR